MIASGQGGQKLLESHRPTRVIADWSEELLWDRGVPGAHLTDSRPGDAEMGRQSAPPALLAFEPTSQIHAASLAKPRLGCQAFSAPPAFRICSTVKEHRRQRLRDLLAGPPFGGSRAVFGQVTGLTKGRISQLLDPKEPFGDVAARRLASGLGLPEDYFDRPAVDAPSPTAVALDTALHQMSPPNGSGSSG